jgi:hypothetical protein
MVRLVGFETPRFRDTDTQAAEVTKWRVNYTKLVSTLGSIGTEVRRSRILEKDQDIEPKLFVRDSVHEFIFPPQGTVIAEDKSGVIDSTPGYTLRKEDVTRTFDETQVEGHVQVRYDDADGRISFHVTDVKGDSQIPAEAQAALEVLYVEVGELQGRVG